MKRVIRAIFIVYGFITHAASQQGLAPHTIICYCKPAIHLYADTPKSITFPRDEREMSETIFEKQIAKYTQRGVIATYHGYMAISDHNGELLFPRKHTRDDIFYVITRAIRPVVSQGETIQHFTIQQPEHTRMYYLQRKQDKEQKTTYWDVHEISVEQGQKIPASAIIIFSRPEHIVVPTGTFATIDGGNLLLPDLYITKDIPIGPNALAFLRVNKYFAPVTHAYAYTSDRYATGVRP